MSIGSILNMARTAMNAQQTAVQSRVAEHRNATTAGYSRQRVELADHAADRLSVRKRRHRRRHHEHHARARHAARRDVSHRTPPAPPSADTQSDGAVAGSVDLRRAERHGIERVARRVLVGVERSRPAIRRTSRPRASCVETGNNVANTLNQFCAAARRARPEQSRGDERRRQPGQPAHAADCRRQPRRSCPRNRADNRRTICATRATCWSIRVTTIVGGQVVEHPNGSVAVYTGGRMLVDDTTVKQLR